MYCEKTIFETFFEPANSLSNLGFFVSSFCIYHFLTRSQKSLFHRYYFAIVVLCIAIGSFLWHFYPTKLTVILDSVPIFIFMLSFLIFYSSEIAKTRFHSYWMIGFFFVFVPSFSYLANLFVQTFFQTKISSMGYASVITYFLVLQIYNSFHKKTEISKAILISALFGCSIFFRAIDVPICQQFPLGTHFIWHILNSITLFLMVKLLYQIRFQRTVHLYS